MSMRGEGGREGGEGARNELVVTLNPSSNIYTHFSTHFTSSLLSLSFYPSFTTHNSYFPDTINLAQPTPRRGAESSACC